MKNTTNNVESRRESGSYPYYPLSSALKVSDAVKELGGARSEIQKSVLAKHLGESEKAAAFSQRIMAAKCFGLIDGHGAYSLTELAKRYYFPTTESDKSSALLQVFSTPAPFAQLLRRFDGDKIPSREILANILHRELGVPESWMERIAGFFTSSAQFVGAIDGQGYLRFKAAQHDRAFALTTVTDEGSAAPAPVGYNSPGSRAPVGLAVNVWDFSYGGKTVRLETPVELETPLWEKLHTYVQLLKPTGSNNES